MSSKNYTIGKVTDHVKTGGWFVGRFMPEGTLQYDTDVEISVKHLPKGWGLNDEHALHYHRVAKEYAIVTKGRAKVQFSGEIKEIGPGDYYILKQGCEEKFLEILEDMELITIKVPSVEDDKIVVTEKR